MVSLSSHCGAPEGRDCCCPLGTCPPPTTAELLDLRDPVRMDGLLVPCSQEQIGRTSVNDETNSPSNRGRCLVHRSGKCRTSVEETDSLPLGNICFPDNSAEGQTQWNQLVDYFSGKTAQVQWVMLQSLTTQYPLYRIGNRTGAHQQWNILIYCNWILMLTLHYFSLLYLLCLPVTHVHTLKIPNVQLCQIPQQAWNTNSRASTPFIAHNWLVRFSPSD